MSVVAALALLTVAAGCGDDSGNGSAGRDAPHADDRREIRAVMDGFRIALEKGDPARGCPLLTENFKQALMAFPGGRNCRAAFVALSKERISEDLTPRILEMDIGPSSATVVGWVSHQNERQTARFAKQGGHWKLVNWFMGT